MSRGGKALGALVWSTGPGLGKEMMKFCLRLFEGYFDDPNNILDDKSFKCFYFLYFYYTFIF